MRLITKFNNLFHTILAYNNICIIKKKNGISMDKSFNEINNIHLFYSSFKDYDCLKSRDEFNK